VTRYANQTKIALMVADQVHLILDCVNLPTNAALSDIFEEVWEDSSGQA
jgi:hypothetical protein